MCLLDESSKDETRLELEIRPVLNLSNKQFIALSMCLRRFIALSIQLLDTVNKA